MYQTENHSIRWKVGLLEGRSEERRSDYLRCPSTTHAMLDFINHIYKYISNQKHSAAVFIDLSKAFVTTDHGILLIKLEKYGIRETELLFFKNIS